MHSEPTVDAAIFVLNEERRLLDIIEQLRPITQINQRLVVTPSSSIALLLSSDSTITVVKEEHREGKTAAVMKALAASKSRDFMHIAGDDIITTQSIQLMIDTMATGKYGCVVSHVKTLGDRDNLIIVVGSLLWEIYNMTNHYLNKSLRAKTGDVYIVRKSLVPEISRSIINDDAYIDSRLKREGSGSIEVEAYIWTQSPKTVFGYILQRSRVVQGHLQLLKVHEEEPSTIEFSHSIPIRERLNVISQALRQDRRYFTAFPFLILLEILSWVVALLDMLRGRANTVWRREGDKT